MRLNIEPEAVNRVHIAGEWIDIEPGSFRIAAFTFNSLPQDAVDQGGDPGFEFTSRRDRTIVSGPLSSIIAVQRKAEPLIPQEPIERLATLFQTRGGALVDEAVHFAHAGRPFQVEFDARGWVCSSRGNDSYSEVYSAGTRPEELVSQIMGDLKVLYGQGL
ncbi:hypothetical protein ACFWXO_05390 [Kitasatospora sp. NPDC059088]|uniref:hypothetical protein n=1 Tax=Kitasatospora sp. NPDC059088 TaxID=3346722 RepID=UPI0036CDBD56